MSENCNQSCDSCSEDCAERQEQKTDFSEKLHEMSSVKKVIGVVSGKGGVGKSLVTSMLAVTMILIIGLVENMSYFKCPDNSKDYQIFGESHIEEIADKHNLKVLAKLPIDPKISTACDKGMIELFGGSWLEPVAKILEKMEEN